MAGKPARYDILLQVTTLLLAAALHALALRWWLARDTAAPMPAGTEGIVVELLAPPTATGLATPQTVATESLPQQISEQTPVQQETLRDDEMAAAARPAQKKPPQPPRPAAKTTTPASSAHSATTATTATNATRASTAATDATTSAITSAITSTTSVPPSAPAPITPARHDAAYLNNPKPSYPPTSRRLGEEGRVLLQVRVSVDGKPSAVSIKQSSGFSRLDEAARKAVQKWRFVPAQQNGSAIESDVEIPVLFGLKQ